MAVNGTTRAQHARIRSQLGRQQPEISIHASIAVIRYLVVGSTGGWNRIAPVTDRPQLLVQNENEHIRI